jgi:hypothetical protein
MLMAHACNPNHLGDRVGGSWFEANLDKSLTTLHLQNKQSKVDWRRCTSKRVPALQTWKPWVQVLVPPKQKFKKKTDSKEARREKGNFGWIRRKQIVRCGFKPKHIINYIKCNLIAYSTYETSPHAAISPEKYGHKRIKSKRKTRLYYVKTVSVPWK